MNTVTPIRPALDIKSAPIRYTTGTFVDGDDLGDEIRRAGQRMEAAYAAGRRDLARVWMDCMYGLLRARNGAAGGVDIEAEGVA